MAATAYVSGTLVQGLLILNYPDYGYERWHGTLLFYAALAFALFVNTFLARLLPQIETLILVFHILGFFGLLIPLVHLSPHQSAKEVFTHFVNLGGWSTTGLSFFVGLVTAADAFPGECTIRAACTPFSPFIIGLDAADHIGKLGCGGRDQSFEVIPNSKTAEEIHNAPKVIPISMAFSTMLNGTLGFAMLLALLFCMPDDIESVLGSDTFYPFMNIYAYAVGSNTGATAMVSRLR